LKGESQNTRNRDEDFTLLHARNEAARQPQLNLQIAKAYLTGPDSGVSTQRCSMRSMPALKMKTAAPWTAGSVGPDI